MLRFSCAPPGGAVTQNMCSTVFPAREHTIRLNCLRFCVQGRSSSVQRSPHSFFSKQGKKRSKRIFFQTFYTRETDGAAISIVKSRISEERRTEVRIIRPGFKKLEACHNLSAARKQRGIHLHLLHKMAPNICDPQHTTWTLCCLDEWMADDLSRTQHSGALIARTADKSSGVS